MLHIVPREGNAIKRKTTLRFRYTSIRKAKAQNTGNTRYYKNVELQELLLVAGGECTAVQPLGPFLSKLNLLSSHDQENMPLAFTQKS